MVCHGACGWGVDKQIKNVEYDFLCQSLKEGLLMSIELVSGKELLGRVKRFAVLKSTKGT